MTDEHERARFDLSILADLGALVGASCIAWGLWQLHYTPIALIWIGVVVLAGSVLAVLPPKTQKRDELPGVPALTNDRI